ncbi:MAG: soluble lytic murein transglycosylase [Rhodospirillaceae bacterium]|nr:MAG: soluble lytic murein transglycosylase [Rhodospirillaceae bacterium]
MVKTVVFAVLLFCCFPAFLPPASADILNEDTRRHAEAAFTAAHTGRWEDAHAHARTHKLLAKILKWMDYSRVETKASFAEISAFVRENLDWPQIPSLIRRAEDAIAPAESPAVLRDWFRDHPPLTPNGTMAWVQLLLGQEDAECAGDCSGWAAALVRESWVKDTFGTAQEKHFLSLHGHRLRPEDHTARLDRLLWDHQAEAARRMLPKVNAGWQALAEARLLLAEGKAVALAKVPAHLRNDPGLVYERVRWRRKKEQYLEAIALLSSNAADKGRPALWWTERAALAREALALGQAGKAYEVARTHGKLSGAQFAEAEWLAGWVALRRLKEAKLAHTHFTRMHEGVRTPISLSRAAYWAGRAAEAMGEKEEAAKWYRKAAPHVISYYGQLAAGRLNGNTIGLPEDPLPTASDIEMLDRHELAGVVALLTEVGRRENIRPFVFRLGEIAQTPGQHALAARLTVTAKRPDIAVALARRSAQSGVIMVASGYPLVRLRVQEPPEHALVLAVIRQESNFHAGAVSIAGARGLMQLMPATAKQMATRHNIRFTTEALTANPEYNITLGTTFLEDLVNVFKGSYVLAIAAYNAGPSRAEQWTKTFGDPRKSLEDAVDWVESIPFSETRNYVQRVLEGLQIYRRRLGATELRLSLENDLRR